MYGGVEGAAPLILNLGNSHFTPRERAPIPTVEEAKRAPELVWMRWRREENPFFAPPQEQNPADPARSLVTKLTELPRLWMSYSSPDNFYC
jgi:hypothetical protein